MQLLPESHRNGQTDTKGTGGRISFGNQTIEGEYTATAVNSTGCDAEMNGSVIVSIVDPPIVFDITTNNDFCIEDGIPLTIGLSGSETDVQYQIRRINIPVGQLVNGTGNPFDFGEYRSQGTYSVIAFRGLCEAQMNGVVNPSPVQYNLESAGNSAVCPGETGLNISLSNSQVGVTYQLLRDQQNVGTQIAGTGNGLFFGNQTTAGNYTITAKSSLGCEAKMKGFATVTVRIPPSIFDISDAGIYCQNGRAIQIALEDTEPGTSYQVKRNGTNYQTARVGNGGPIVLPAAFSEGNYTVQATNSVGCNSEMNGSIEVLSTPAPTAFNVTGGGSFCIGSDGVNVGLSGSEVGVSYQLQRDGADIGSLIGGTGGQITFGRQSIPGEYISLVRFLNCCVTIFGKVLE